MRIPPEAILCEILMHLEMHNVFGIDDADGVSHAHDVLGEL